MSYKSVSVITGDAAIKIPVGGSITFTPKGAKFSVREDAAYIENWDVLDGGFVMLSFEDDLDYSVTGSGVIVSPGIVLCATHVIDEHIDELISGKKKFKAHALKNDSHQIWSVLSIVRIPKTDLCLLSVKLISDLPENMCFSTLSITSRTPHVGEIVHVVGFRSNGSVPQGDDVTIDGGLVISSGKVIDVHLKSRDSYFLNWPCFGIECQSWGGMSGGPVFDSNGYLIGILCSSYENNKISYASILWEALLIPAQNSWPPVTEMEGKPLIQRINDGCYIQRPDAFELKENGSYDYKLWT